MLSKNEIKQLIETALTDAEVEILDPMNDGVHLGALIISDSFAGKSRVLRHRMVYSALGDAFSGPLHALQITTKTKEEHAKQQF